MRLFKFIFLLFFLIFSCQNENTKIKKSNFKKNIINKTNDNKNNNIENKLKQQIYSVLNINSNEKIDYKIYYELLNKDTIKDAIITINRLDFAIKSAVNDKNISKRAELGYLGAYNYFFFYDGKTDRLSVPITIASSAKTPLKVEFINLEDNSFKNLTIEYRIRNSAFKNYYLLNLNEIKLVFQWKLFDKIGDDNYEAYFLDYSIGKFSLVKDINVYRGIIENYSKSINNIYQYNPLIKNSGEKYYTFFYDIKKMKYATFDKPK